jgi:transposase
MQDTSNGPYVGIDISQAKLDVAIDQQEPFLVARTAEGLADLVAKLAPLRPTLVVMEATGGLETIVAVALEVAKIPVVVINPQRARAFAEAEGIRAKTDAIDAKPLALFGRKINPQRRALPEETVRDLDGMLDRRRQPIGMRAMEQNRSGSAANAKVRGDVEAPIKWLDERIEQIDREMDQTIQSSPIWKVRDELPRGVPGDRAGAEPDAAGRRARVGDLERPEDLGPGGPGPDRRGQRHRQRAAAHPRRPGCGEGGAVHGGALGVAIQPGDQAVRRPPEGGR